MTNESKERPGQDPLPNRAGDGAERTRMCRRHLNRNAFITASVLWAGLGYSSSGRATLTTLDLATLPSIATINQSFQSYNIEMAEVIGGNFWKPYGSQGEATSAADSASASGGAGLQLGNPAMFEARPPINLSNARLRKLATALGPAYLRVSGTWANTVYFQDTDDDQPTKPPNGFKGVLTRREWAGVVDFSHAVDARILTSVAIGEGVRDAAGVWKPDQAQKLLAYTKSIGGEISALEFFNEPTMPQFGEAPPGYNAVDYARDFAVFRSFMKGVAPETPIAGPSAVGEAIILPGTQKGAIQVLPTVDILSAPPPPVFDIYAYHFYGADSIRCASLGPGTQTTPEVALSEEWLARADRSYAFYAGLRDRFEPGKAIWITEMADAACGGNPWAATILDAFRYLDQHARLAKHGVQIIFHNTFASSEYGLLDQRTFAPRPTYWAALLFHKLMGTTVLDAGPAQPNLHLYAQCLPADPGGVTVLAINTSPTESKSIDLPARAERYTLMAQKLEASDVELNGQQLRLGANDDLPELEAQPMSPGHVTFAPVSITFLAVKDAHNPNCH